MTTKAKAIHKQRIEPHGIAETGPQNVITAAAISAAAAVAKLGVDGARSLRSGSKPDARMNIRVMDSKLVKKVVDGSVTGLEHSIDLHMVNESLHGVYLELLEIADPKGVPIGIFLHGEIAVPARTVDAAWYFPKLIPPGHKLELTVRFDLLDKTGFGKRPYAKFVYTFSVLGDSKKEEEDSFLGRLRWG
jgi:hypothetical protein